MSPRRIEKIISGGQTGVDRAALDIGLELGIPIGGYCPKGRRSEDGTIPAQYPLIETNTSNYGIRTEKNVIESDGTLILNVGQVSSGTAYNIRMAIRTNGRILRNEEVRKKFLDSFSLAKREIDIISPWVNRLALNADLQKRMEDALKRNVRVRIIYGIGGQMDTDNERLSRSQAVISGLCHSFQKYGDLFTVRLDNAHEKLLLCDDSFMLVGSFNLLSFDGNYEQDTRKEMMYYFENPEQVTKARNTYFDF